MGWNKKYVVRYLINKKANDYLAEDLSQLNHGLENTSSNKMEKYLKLLINNNIYRHTHIISKQDDIKNSHIYSLTSMKDYVSYSKKEETNNLTKVIKLNAEFDKIFFMIKFDKKEKQNCQYILKNKIKFKDWLD